MDAAATPRHRLVLLLVVAVLSLAVLGGCDDDDGETTPDDPTASYCQLGAKAVELIGSQLRAGTSAKQIIEDYGGGLDKACEAAIKAWRNRPQDPVQFTLTGPDGNPIENEEFTGQLLLNAAPESPETGQPSCANWAIPRFRELCFEQALNELKRSIAEQQGQ
jgi:hypothetical protein